MFFLALLLHKHKFQYTGLLVASRYEITDHAFMNFDDDAPNAEEFITNKGVGSISINMHGYDIKVLDLHMAADTSDHALVTCTIIFGHNNLHSSYLQSAKT